MRTTVYAWDQLLRTVRAAVEPYYAVVELIGVGGMASVYLAHRRSDGCAVALKIMHTSLASDPANIVRFEREASTMTRIAHPHIVRIHSFIRTAGLIGFEMAYLPGGSLAQLMATHPEGLPFAIVLHWLAQIGSAVSFAHAAGVVHRDLNMSNILLDEDGNTAVADFGIAIAADETRLTQVGQRIGAPAYMSPEQLSDVAATTASDQYSLGVIAYELLAGRRPFYGSIQAVADAHRTQVPPPLTKMRPDCSAAIADAIARMLAKRSEARFASIDDALNALEARTMHRADPQRQQLRELIPARAVS